MALIRNPTQYTKLDNYIQLEKFSDPTLELKDKHKFLESRIEYLEKEIENMKLDFLIKLDSLLNNDNTK